MLNRSWFLLLTRTEKISAILFASILIFVRKRSSKNSVFVVRFTVKLPPTDILESLASRGRRLFHCKNIQEKAPHRGAFLSLKYFFRLARETRTHRLRKNNVPVVRPRSEEHTSELQSHVNL